MITLHVASPWFTTAKVDDHVTLITEPHVGDLIAANLWWINGSLRDVVIDTGLGIGSLRSQLPRMFGNSPLAVVTHTHLDHVGGAYEFNDVAVHELEAITALHPEAASLHTVTEFGHLGIEIPADELPPLLLDALPSAEFDPNSYAVRPAAVTRLLSDGTRIDLGDRTLTIIHLPGHSPGSIALHDEKARTLYSGDVIYDDELLDKIYGADIPQYVESMKRLLTLDVDIVHPGHGPSFGGERMRKIATAYIQQRR